jgi:hypothetical protein
MNVTRCGLLFAASLAGVPFLSTAALAADEIVYAGYGGTYQEAVRKGALEPVAQRARHHHSRRDNQLGRRREGAG